MGASATANTTFNSSSYQYIKRISICVLGESRELQSQRERWRRLIRSADCLSDDGWVCSGTLLYYMYREINVLHLLSFCLQQSFFPRPPPVKSQLQNLLHDRSGRDMKYNIICVSASSFCVSYTHTRD
jgi:hypothetical protein